MKKLFRILLCIIVIGAVAAAGIAVFRSMTAPEKQWFFREEKLARQDLASTISASGTVEPEELVNVGAQVSGMIMSFGSDADGKTVDYGSRVTAGMVLAKIDEVLYESELREKEANKLQAKVGILSAEANIRQTQAQLVLAERNWKRAQELYSKKAQSKSEYDSAEASFLTAQAAVAVNQAALEKARADEAIAEAALVKARRNLSYCVIKSPVDGIIIDRRVSIGQTLVSNMSASSIFLIATDLRKMQVWVSVNEADIGSIKTGMPVTFTVDAFPGREFQGVVHKVRLNATMSQNVVTYVVEVTTDNADLKLLPYLTANVKFILAQSRNVLAVSNAALRYTPDPAMVEPASRALLENASSGRERLVWTTGGVNGLLRAIRVTAGLNNGVMTEVSSPELREGMAIVSGHSEVAPATAANGEKRSPFLPSPPPHAQKKNGAAKNAPPQR